MRTKFFVYKSAAGLLLAALVSACSGQAQIKSVVDAATYDGPKFSNILVIGVANDYDGRAQFERELSSNLRNLGSSATEMYKVGGGDKPIAREDIEALVKQDGYDAVLITRVLKRDTDLSRDAGSTDLKATRRADKPLDLFRYDYEELNEPVVLDVDLNVVIESELFTAADSTKVWAVEVSLSEQENLGVLIAEAARTIADRIGQDRLIAN